MFLRRVQLGAAVIDVPVTSAVVVRPEMDPKFRRFAAYASVAADLMIAIGGAYTIWHTLFAKKKGPI